MHHHRPARHRAAAGEPFREAAPAARPDGAASLAVLEQRMVTDALDRARGNKSKAASPISFRVEAGSVQSCGPEPRPGPLGGMAC